MISTGGWMGEDANQHEIRRCEIRPLARRSNLLLVTNHSCSQYRCCNSRVPGGVNSRERMNTGPVVMSMSMITEIWPYS